MPNSVLIIFPDIGMPVTLDVQPGDLRKLMPQYPPKEPEEFRTIITDFDKLLMSRRHARSISTYCRLCAYIQVVTEDPTDRSKLGHDLQEYSMRQRDECDTLFLIFLHWQRSLSNWSDAAVDNHVAVVFTNLSHHYSLCSNGFRMGIDASILARQR